jgi:hypothetical protein
MNDRLTGRRELLLHILPACSLCLGLSRFVAAAADQESQPLSLAKRAAEKTEMSYADLFKYSYGGMIPVLLHLSDQIGKEKFIEMLKKAASEASAKEAEEAFKNQPKRDLVAYLESMKKPGPLYQHALTFEFIKDTEKEAEVRITECLWAQTFRQANAADIGFAMVCNPDVAILKAYNSRIALNRPKLLMKGDNECRFLWTMGA